MFRIFSYMMRIAPHSSPCNITDIMFHSRPARVFKYLPTYTKQHPPANHPPTGHHLNKTFLSISPNKTSFNHFNGHDYTRMAGYISIHRDQMFLSLRYTKIQKMDDLQRNFVPPYSTKRSSAIAADYGRCSCR